MLSKLRHYIIAAAVILVSLGEKICLGLIFRGPAGFILKRNRNAADTH